MDIFGDEKYKQLDWLTKAVEPITWSVADKLLTLPASYSVTIDDIKEIINKHKGISRIDTTDLFIVMLKNSNIKLINNEMAELLSCYQIQIPKDGINIDLEANTMSAPMEMIKIKESFTNEELEKKMGLYGNRTLDGLYASDLEDEKAMERVNEILDLMGIKSHKHKVGRRLRDVKLGYVKIMSNNEWKIRNVDLSDRVGQWIKDYILHGNLAAFTNFCKVKAITHRGYPIYSIEEEE